MNYLLTLLFTFSTFAQSNKFIILDNETLEFVGEVNYALYLNKKIVFSNTTSKDSITCLPIDFIFDSISLKKNSFKETGFKIVDLKEVVLLSKAAFELDEVIIPNIKSKEIAIGEVSRFIKKKSRNLSNTIDYGLLFRKYDLNNKSIKKLVFFIEKVKYRTAYKIKFYSVQEIGNPLTFQSLQFNELFFESPILNLEIGTKNKVEIDLVNYNIDTQDKDVFICIELQAYYDENNNIIQPQIKDKTKLKFQLSNLINYYSKTVDATTKIQSDNMININSMINRDFAFQFFKKPHKSQLVTPAIILNTVMKK
jgi:hypothetical protein